MDGPCDAPANAPLFSVVQLRVFPLTAFLIRAEFFLSDLRDRSDFSQVNVNGAFLKPSQILLLK